MVDGEFAMDPEQIAAMIRTGLQGADVVVDDPRGDRHHFEARVVWDQFEGMNRVKRHRNVYKTLGAAMGSDQIHALAMVCLTPTEFTERQNNKGVQVL